MTKNFILSGTLLLAVVLSSGCSRQPTIPEAEFGETVRNVMQKQIHDYEAAIHPDPNAVEGSDVYRLDAALEAYRENVSAQEQPQRPITLSLGAGQR